jgi:Domain of unknown function (DUF4382)
MARKRIVAGPRFPRRAQSAGGLTALCGATAVLFSLAFGGVLCAADSAAGLLEVRVKDHREAIGDFSRLTLKLGKIAISPKAGLAVWQVGWRDLPPSLQTIDLTRYTGKESAIILRKSIDAGAFDGIQLKLDGIEGILKKTQRPASVKNTLAPIKLQFSIEPKGQTTIVLDLVVLDMSDHPPRGYELGIKGYELYGNGKLIDRVPPG